jgi:hypothetical protein
LRKTLPEPPEAKNMYNWKECSRRVSVTKSVIFSMLLVTPGVILAQSAQPAMSPRAGQSQLASAGNLDPSKRSEIADISNFFHSMKLMYVPMMGVGINGYESILKDPSASKFETKITIANGFLYRSRVGDQEAWKNDLIRLGYMKTARSWYQLAFSQLKQEHPEIDPAVYPPPDDRSPVPVTELPRLLKLNKGKDVGDSASRELRSFILDGYKNFKDTPNDATIESTQVSLEQAQRQAQLQEGQARKVESDKREVRLKELQALGESAERTTLKNKTVIFAVVAYLNDADDRHLANLNKQVAKLQDSMKNCEKNTSLDELPLNKSAYEVCRDRGDRYKQSINYDQHDISNFKYRTSQYEITVAEPDPHNYEGNMISYVNFRAKGTDHIDLYKVTMQFKNNAWVVVQCGCDS